VANLVRSHDVSDQVQLSAGDFVGYACKHSAALWAVLLPFLMFWLNE
jgi:hypothetical protein